MPPTKEVRFYCDRCGQQYATSGEDGEMPSGVAIFCVMEIDTGTLSADGDRDPFHQRAPRYKRPAHHLQIGERRWESRMDYGRDSRSSADNGEYEDHMAQVCPRCADEFEHAKNKLKDWWENGKTLLATGGRTALAAAADRKEIEPSRSRRALALSAGVAARKALR